MKKLSDNKPFMATHDLADLYILYTARKIFPEILHFNSFDHSSDLLIVSKNIRTILFEYSQNVLAILCWIFS